MGCSNSKNQPSDDDVMNTLDKHEEATTNAMIRHGRQTMERRETARMLSTDGFKIRPRPHKRKPDQHPKFKPGPKGVPTLNYWVQINEGKMHTTIQGELFGCLVVDGDAIDTGERIETGPIVKGDIQEFSEVVTNSGSRYWLGEKEEEDDDDDNDEPQKKVRVPAPDKSTPRFVTPKHEDDQDDIKIKEKNLTEEEKAKKRAEAHLINERLKEKAEADLAKVKELALKKHDHKAPPLTTEEKKKKVTAQAASQALLSKQLLALEKIKQKSATRHALEAEKDAAVSAERERRERAFQAKWKSKQKAANDLQLKNARLAKDKLDSDRKHRRESISGGKSPTGEGWVDVEGNPSPRV
ncbi:hypothetical protein TrVE_jg2154 [Triparma verrucosa]|uniref:Uncharacterized protein n=1 Tax=Triparma verrucosa TaxID=1606542 RepID=A0A9W7B2W6_9STRA|nr:hypothetical protein TrVE_jg2154 [Triparma verrucosa]